MALKMKVRLTRWGTLSEISLRTIKATNFKLSVSYSHAAKLTWTCLMPQHQQPIPDGAYIVFWDDAEEDADGNPFSDTNPIFVGYVETPAPGQSSRQVNYVAYDPTNRARNKAIVFSGPWAQGDVSEEIEPTPPEDGVPRLVYNCTINADPDWSFQVDGGGTVGMICRGILQWCYHPLYWCDAAPGDGSDEGNGVAYVDADLDALTHRPQEKLDFQSESVGSALDRLQRYDPRFKFVFDPVAKQWRFRNLTTAPTVTMRLNDPDVDHPVLALQISPSTENAITAISIYGPPTTRTAVFDYIDFSSPSAPTSSPNGPLVPYGDYYIFQNYSDARGMQIAACPTSLQIYNAADRRGARLLSDWYSYNLTSVLTASTNQPRVLISFNGGQTWVEWNAVYFDYLAGIVYFAGRPPFFYQANSLGQSIVPASTQTYFVPNMIRLIWAPYEAPLKVRVPTSGFEGTAYTIAGRKFEDHRYDEALAVGKEYGTPVTTAARRAAFTTYGQAILDQRKDIVWTGSATLHNLDWEYLRLNRRVNFEADDGSGNDVSTGWETIDAFVTDVEYDFAARTTQVTFSGDKLAIFGVDPEQLKADLKIRALEQRAVYDVQHTFRTFTNMKGYKLTEIGGTAIYESFQYVDPETGESG